MYKELDTKQVNQLTVVRHGWWGPEYELTAGNASYGKLCYDGISKRYATAETATNQWTFSFKALFDKSILITDQNGTLIGESTREFFSRTRTLTLQSGFSASFFRPSVWSRQYVWQSVGYGKIMSITNRFPFILNTDVYIDQTQTPPSIIPLLIFLGTHLTILRRRRRAAH
ncbi:MAG: hypothetical protein JWQ79_1511 [Mucilaginibacter sp.]|jgi:hypothetical protein|nr:hypothetical protein [Mucilaginibacter sp.]